MAGIGVRLNKIFSKNTITTNLMGFGYSTVITIAPMFLVIACVTLMQVFLGFSGLGYAQRELYSCTVLYIFIFALLTASPFNAVLSRYMSDVIYEEWYEDILPCYYVGLIMNLVLSCAAGIPFCIREYIVGEVELPFVFAGYCGYTSLVLVFYSMLYLSICKDYQKISIFFLIGMAASLLLSLFFVYVINMSVTYAMLIALDIGLMLIASLEFALVKSYFRRNSARYREVLLYFKKNWQLVATNFLYNLGMYIHNFVFWTTDLRMVVAESFVSVTTYDMATCIAMFTNISSSVIFISRVEMHFHERYKNYSEAVIGGRGMDISNAKDRMFGQLADELMSLVRIQFIVSTVIYFLFIIILPQFGFGGLVMQIYPSLAAGYFILFIMYAAIIFLYYYNDLNGALAVSFIFCVCTMLGAVLATRLTPIWYGIGPVIGATAGWCAAYSRLRYMEKNIDIHIFCSGSIMKKGHGRKPSNRVYLRENDRKE
ncbi:MAG: exopolysaccharide Pel transporter PelG [Lachnospiraceae bacterium]|nr:exopolysaccharide Pel transporter PelG [Lachnospiraceae bacterium]